jgi:hypothetical protein
VRLLLSALVQQAREHRDPRLQPPRLVLLTRRPLADLHPDETAVSSVAKSRPGEHFCILAVTRAPSGRGAGATPLGSAAASALLAGYAAACAATHLLPCRIAFAPLHHPPAWGHPPHCSGQTDTAIPSRKMRCLAQKRWRQSGRYEICSQAYLSWGAASTKSSSPKLPPTSPAPSPRARSTTTASPTPPDPLTRTPRPSGASVRASAVPEGCNWAASSATAATAPPRSSWLWRGCQSSRFVAGCYGSPAFTRVGSETPPAQALAGAPCLAPKRR